MTDLTVPIGVHPGDPSVPLDEAMFGDHPVPHDQGDLRAARGRKPWGTSSSNAVPVFQRLGTDLDVGVTIVNSALGDSGTARIVSRRPGRTRLSLWVPTSYFPGGTLTATPAGILWSDDEGELQQGEGGVPLFIGESVDISSEAGVWVGVQPGQTIGVVAWQHSWSPPQAD